MSEPRIRILNVNDDDASRYVVTRTLQLAGYQVLEAATGAEALTLAATIPELIVLDVKLPDMSGFEVVRRLRANARTASIIVLHTSATFVTSEKRVQGLDGGADGYLVQPMEPAELVATVRSLLRARRAEEAARRAARQWQATFDAIGDGVCIVNDEGRIEQANAALGELLRMQVPAIVGRHYEDILTEALGVPPPFSPLRTKGEKTRASATFAAGDQWYRLSVDPVQEEGESAGSCVCILSDITEQQRTSEALRESEARFHRVANANVIGLFFLGMDGIITDANDAFLEMTGYERSDLAAQKLTRWALTPPQNVEAVRAARETLFREGVFRAFEMELQRKDGRRIPVLLGGAFADENRNSLVAFVLDSSHRKKLEAELRERVAALADADRRKDEFLAMLAHELRNPLSAIATSLYLQDRVGAQDDRNVRLRATVSRQVKHLSRLVDDLLDVSRVTRGKIQLKKEKLDLVQLVRQAVQGSRPMLDTRQHTLWTSLPETPLWVEADTTRVEQIVTNLLSNAAKYTDPGGEVSVKLTAEYDREQAWAVLRVRDTGIGIPPDLLERVFDLFVQADQSLARSQGGLGIGLTMAQNLVRMHGGTITATSPGHGKGSEFIVHFPLAVATTAALPSADIIEAGREAAGRALDVILVEDNADARETMRYLLDLWGHNVRAAADGGQAMELFRERLPDAALVDIGLQGMDGHEVAKTVRRLPNAASVFLVALTGYGRLEDRARSAAAGFDLHLVKPTDAKDLLAALNEASRRRGIGAPPLPQRIA